MRNSGLSRLYRRIIIKHFGSTKNFVIWTLAVVATIYFIDSFVLTRDRLQSLVIGPHEKSVQINQQKTDGVQGVHVEQPLPPSQDSKHSAGANPVCGLTEACPAGQYAYLVRSGYARDNSPTICFNGETAFPDKKAGERGINLVVVNDKTLKIEEVRSFDTYTSDDALSRFLKLGVKDGFIVLAATQDEATYHLKENGKSWIRTLGSSLVAKLGFRENLVLLGQRGLASGAAIEKHAIRTTGAEFAEQIEITGCLSLPMGKLTAAVGIDEKPAAVVAVAPADGVKLGEELPNCGVKEPCTGDNFPVHLYSGMENKEGPKICVSGKYVIAKGLNDGGRGINIAVVNPKTKEVIRVGHFDTYSEDSSNLEIFLEMLNEKEIIVAVSNDDASKKFSDHAKQLFDQLGSGLVQNIKFRDVWAFAGQSGISGYGDIEEIEFVPPSGDWPRSIDKKVCVPTEIKGSKIKPDPLANKNEKRRNFCAKFDGYGDFCETEHVDEALTPAPLTDKTLENHKIFKTPIVIIPGLNHNAVRMQLETMLLNPGIQPDMVMVLYDEKFSEPASLAELFGFKAAKLSSSTKYIFQMEKALEKVWELYTTAEHVIILEEEVIPSQDLLSFLAQSLPAVEADATLAGISSWNENGYKGLSSSSDLVYRAATMPGLGFLLKKSFYDAAMKGKMADCCHARSWDGWFRTVPNIEMVLPDVSRVYRRPYEGLSEQADFLKQLFNRPRVTNMNVNAKLTNVASLSKAAYEVELEKLLGSASALDTANVEDCLMAKGIGFYVPQSTGKIFSIYFEQSAISDYSILKHLCRCFGLFAAPGFDPRGVHQGLLRFTLQGNTVLFVGSKSPYSKFMPSGYKIIKLSQLSS